MRGGRSIQNEDAARQRRLEELREKVEKFQPVETYVSPDCPPYDRDLYLPEPSIYQGRPTE